MASIAGPHGGNGYVDHPVMTGDQTLGTVTDQIAGTVLTRPFEKRWLAGLTVAVSLLMCFFLSVASGALRLEPSR